MDDRCLVLFDADRIRDYVFTSGRLREIRGASELVRQLTDADALIGDYGTWEPGASDGEGVIYAGGGGGAIVVRGSERAEQVCRELERRFRSGTGGATLTAVWEPIGPGPDTDGAEAAAQAQAARSLARRKASRPHAELAPGGAVRFCASDRLFPASGTSPDPAGPLFVSHATATRRKLNQEYRSALRGSRFWELFAAQLPAGDVAAWENSISRTQDMGGIGRQSEPEGYVALVYADGDRVGRTIRDVVRDRGFQGYRDFSAALTEAATLAAAKSLYAAYGKRPPHAVQDADEDVEAGKRALPFEVITIGGDDILLLCTAERGLAVACALAREFREAIANLDEAKPVTASVGVVIAHESMPILTLERAGRDLLTSAKNAKDANNEPVAGGIDFHIVTASGIDRIGRVRTADYQVGTDSKAELTKRPYTLEGAETLLEHARKIRGDDPESGSGLPGTKIADLHDACRGPLPMASLNVLGVHARLAPAQSALLTGALRDLDSVSHYPFSAADPGEPRRTALIDLLEASEFAGDPWRMDP